MALPVVHAECEHNAFGSFENSILSPRLGTNDSHRVTVSPVRLLDSLNEMLSLLQRKVSQLKSLVGQEALRSR